MLKLYKYLKNTIISDQEGAILDSLNLFTLVIVKARFGKFISRII